MKQYFCKQCGSSDICFDAYAKWDAESQYFKVYNTYEETWCRECDGENTVKVVYSAESNEGAASCTD